MHHDHASIFGDTYEGVPSPLVFHTHPYPTRYHGTILTTPRFGQPYRENPYLMPFPAISGLGDLPQAPIANLCASTGSIALDAAIGAATGYLAAPEGEQTAWAIGGAVAVGLAGFLGLVGVFAAAAVRRA